MLGLLRAAVRSSAAYSRQESSTIWLEVQSSLLMETIWLMGSQSSAAWVRLFTEGKLNLVCEEASLYREICRMEFTESIYDDQASNNDEDVFMVHCQNYCCQK